jgi:thiamine-phosphate pyrophosphorylase
MVLDDARLTAQCKQLRHDLSSAAARIGADLISARDTQHDVGTDITTESECSRRNTAEIAIAASKRVAEALRCLEEYCKLIDPAVAVSIEQLRYRLYALDQEIVLGGPRQAHLRRARLHVLLTAELCRGEWHAVAEQAIAGGADVIQLREKNLSDRELLDRGLRLRDLTARHDVLLIINDRPDIARLVDADGVHLGQEDMPIAAARQIVGSNRLIGRSNQRLNDAQIAQDEGADYIAVGPMFPSPTKPEKPTAGLRVLTEVAPIAKLPLVAIGGVTAQNVQEIIRAFSACQVAVCQAVIAALSPSAAAQAIKLAMIENADRT